MRLLSQTDLQSGIMLSVLAEVIFTERRPEFCGPEPARALVCDGVPMWLLVGRLIAEFNIVHEAAGHES